MEKHSIGDPIYTPLGPKTPVIDSSFSRNLAIFDDTVSGYSAEQRKISVYLTEGSLPELAVFRLECWNDSGFSNITDYNIDYRFKKEFTLQNLTAGTTYYYKITARDPVGNTKESPVLNFTTYFNNSAVLPTLTITRNRMSINASESVGFNSTSNCPDCTYTWSFGDGVQYTGRNTTHSYSSKGVYDVFLHAMNGQGVSFTKRSIVYVLNGSSEPLQTCSQLGGSCCSSGQTCQGGYLQTSSDCSACCTGGTCQTPLCGNSNCDSGECSSCPQDCSLAHCCGDLACQPSLENCQTCPQDCLPGGQVCCSGTAYAGNCCSDPDCSSPTVCISHSCSQPLASLAAHWKLDESSGTTASDSSGNGNTGTLVNGPAWVSGNISGALQFDGTDDYVEVPNNPSIQFNGQAFSISAWIKPAVTTLATRNIAQKDNMNYGTDFPWQLYNYGTGVYFKVRDTSTTREISTASGVSTSVYSHVAATFDPTGNMSLYINGQKKASLNVSGFTFDSSSGSNPLRIGAMSYTSGYYFNGTIVDVRIYSRALNASEILSLYQQQSGPSIHKSDNNPADGCVDNTELFAFMDRWYMNNLDVTLKELIEAIGYWNRGCP